VIDFQLLFFKIFNLTEKTMNKTLTTTAATMMLLGSNFIALDAVAASKEKCYGVVQAGHNDCATKTSSCAGSSTTDNQSDAFVAVPKGLCERLTGGSLTSS
jgi:uncharacterized membrane protein